MRKRAFFSGWAATAALTDENELSRDEAPDGCVTGRKESQSTASAQHVGVVGGVTETEVRSEMAVS